MEVTMNMNSDFRSPGAGRLAWGWPPAPEDHATGGPMQKALWLSVAAIGLALPAVRTKTPEQSVKAEVVSQAEERSFKQWDTVNAYMRTLSELEWVIDSKQLMLEQGFQTPGLAQDIAQAQEIKNRILRRVADAGETGIYSDLSKWKYTPNTKNIAGGYAWTGPAPQPVASGTW